MTTLTNEQSELLSALEDGANILLRTQTNLKKCSKARLTEGYIKARLQGIEEYWKTFNENHQKLTKCTPREQRGVLQYFLQEDFYKCEELYLNLKADLLDLSHKRPQYNQCERMESTNIDTSPLCVKLPRIQLPNFSGRYEEFPTYKDLFTSLVHNNTTLSSVQKLHYLKTSLVGEAEVLLKHIHITEDNYVQAWELLCNRYGSKRILTSTLLKRLFNQKKIYNQSASLIKSLLDTTSECLNSLRNMGIPTDQWDLIVVFLVVQKLDQVTHKEWEEHAYNDKFDELPRWDQLQKFLEGKFRTLELIAPTSSRTVGEKYQKSFHVVEQEEKNSSANNSSYAHQQATCALCNENHFIYNCKTFVRLPVEEKYNIVKKNRLCFNCLIPNHNVFRCKQRTSCRICRRRHHSLLHQERQPTKGDDNTATQQRCNDTEEKETRVNTYYSRQRQTGGQGVLLATALVNIKSSIEESHVCRALIDQGSEASFVTARIANLLKLRRLKVTAKVSGVGEEEIVIKYKVILPIITRTNKIIEVNAYIMKNISTELPSQDMKIDTTIVGKLTLADPTYGSRSTVDILLGAPVYAQIIEEGLIRLQDNLVAQKTILGWILSGQIQTTSKAIQMKSLFTTVNEDNDLLRKFWEIETESYTKRRILTKEEEQCEAIYKSTTKRAEDGRYIVELPMKKSIHDTIQEIGETKEQAIARMLQLERRFMKNKTLKDEYIKVINEYIEMGHMERIENENECNGIYLPHHAVIRNDKDTTKVRVVFDASAKGTKGKSLNDTMMVGPTLQPELRSQITCWRTHKVCVVGDLVKMYRMIKMNDHHTDLQRIVWRNDPQHEIESYRLKTVTFGTAAAPYLAVRTLFQLSDDEANNYPEAAAAIKECFYIDDWMWGHEDEVTATKLCKYVKTVLKRGGFEMQKWSSNSDEVLTELQADKSDNTDGINIKLDSIIKILGLTWNRKNDVFKVTVNLPDFQRPVTKRKVLSDVARLFDPFGWLSPVVIVAKTMIQRLWLCNLTWDDDLSIDVAEEWIKYREELQYLQDIQIPRWFHTTSKCQDIQLHGFSDASTTSYAAVTYLRVMDDVGHVHITIIASRTKVAPLKQLTVPRLELCGAALLAALIDDIQQLLHVPKNNIFAYTDSMVVLSWLQSQPNKWQTFVGNRIAEIQRVIDNSQWRYVQSSDNPADIATRGVKASELKDLELWWAGPEWLKNNDMKHYTTQEIPPTDLEAKRTFYTQIVKNEVPIWERFSTLSRMKRVLAYCMRVTRRERKERNTYLTTEEMEDVLERCVKFYQSLMYEREIQDLQKENRVRKGSSLITLSPFLDKNGVLKVGGRLENATVPESFKHPVIIPRDQHITKLIIKEAHTKTLHGGIQAMMVYIRNRYWIIGLKAAVRKCIHTCKTCILDKARTKHQLMGQLPAVRVCPARAFYNSGVDYAGPVLMRMSKGRGTHAIKGYICLFVCMATRAIHLEAVTDLTAQAFIAAFRRFVSRRGHCGNLWSDNGTNFIGAAKELNQLFKRGKDNITDEVAETLENNGTRWHFIPPKMPNYGGIWEAGVQSAKRHLSRVTGSTKLTYEEMATLLTQVEACLNSRPICQLEKTIDPLTPLTPGHFLIGEPMVGVPDVNYEDNNVNLLTRWQHVQRLIQDFWRRWQSEYLNTMQQRYKWQIPISNIKINDIVVIKENDLPPSKWLLGKVKLLHPGSDNLVRVVTVQCKGNHELKRPVSKLILLPNESNM